MKKNLDVLVMAGIIIFLITGTLIRNEIWNSDAMLWWDSATKSPNKVRPYANLVGALIMEGQYEKAVNWGKRGLQCSGEKPYYLYYNIGNAYHRLRDLPTAYKYARKAVDMNKDDATMQQLGLILKDMGWKEGMPSPETLQELQ
jgi:tetratricopeptide (TPR) repeat protein